MHKRSPISPAPKESRIQGLSQKQIFGISLASVLTLLVVLVTIGIDFGRLDHRYSYSGDSQFKVIQAYSLLHHRFQSEEIFHIIKDVDPKYELYPISAAYILKIGDRYLGAFPVFFSLITALLIKISNFQMLPVFFLALSVLTLVLLVYHYKFSPFLVLLAAFGTPLVLYGYEVSEHPILLFLQLLGLIFFEKKKMRFEILSGVFLASGVFFRLETLIFCAFFCFFLLLLELQSSGWNWISSIKKHFAFLSSVGSTILLFLLLNYLDYGHIFGPRYLVNMGGNSTFSVTEQARRAFVLLFYGHYKLGFFGFTPLFLVVLLWLGRKKYFTKLSFLEKLLLLSSLCLIVVVLLLSPNDGAINWGSRYLNLALLPLLLLTQALMRISSLFQGSKRMLAYLLLLFSSAMCYTGIRIYHAAHKQLRIYQQEFLATKSKNLIMQVEPLVYHAGTMVFSYNFMNPRTENSVAILKKQLQKGRWQDLVYIEPLPPKQLSGLAAEVYQKTLLSEEQKTIRKQIWNNFQITKQSDLKHIRVYYLSTYQSRKQP